MDRIVDDDVARRPLGAVDLEQRDSARMVVVQQVIRNERILHAIHVDRTAAAGPIAIDFISCDDGPCNQSVSSD